MAQDEKNFICRGCGRKIDKDDVTVGHSEGCPYWGRIENARVERNDLHELLRAPSTQTEEYHQLRVAAYDMANVILSITALSEQQQLALRLVRQAMVTAGSAPPRVNQVLPPAGPKEAAMAQSPKGLRTGGRRQKAKNKR